MIPPSRSVLTTAVVVAVVATMATSTLVALAFVPARAVTFPPIPLPIPDELSGAINAQLGALEAGEAQQVAPGPVTDTEAVLVDLGRNGRVATVTVEQRLAVTGVGDFRLRIPGPALDVAALPGITVTPGLQRGAVVWLGFSSGRRDLGARITLDAQQEQFRLPLAVTVRGRDLRFHNQTTQPITLVDAEPEPTALADAYAAVTAQLGRNDRPLAGERGIPRFLPARSGASDATVPIGAPLLLNGTVTTRAGVVPIAAVISEDDATVSLPGAPVSMDFSLTPVLPALASTDRTNQASRDGRATLRAVEVVLAKTARSAALDAYLGNPNPGSSHTTFHYRSQRTAASPLPRREKADVATLALAALAAAMVAATAIAWWRRN